MKIISLILIIMAALTSCSYDYNIYEKPIIVLCFDDCHKGIYDNAFPIMQKFGFPGTNVVNSGYPGFSWYYSWDDLIEMNNAGWETAAHTEKHTNLINLTPAEAEIIIQNDLNNFREKGIFPESFALPAGLVSKEIYDILCRYFKYIRNSQDTENYYPVDPKAIGYFPIQSSYSSSEPIRRIQSAIYRKECLLIIGFHRIQETQDNLQYNCTPQNFQKIMQYIQEQNLNVLTMKSALKACMD